VLHPAAILPWILAIAITEKLVREWILHERVLLRGPDPTGRLNRDDGRSHTIYDIGIRLANAVHDRPAGRR
jgi:hypothetical protein